MTSVFIKRLGIHISKKDFLIIQRFSHEEPKWERLFSQHFNDRSSKVCLEEYQEVKKLKLPSNIRDLPNSEKTGFSSERTRDISSTYITAFSRPSDGNEIGDSNMTNDCDVRIEKYNCLASVNLSSSMQTNVPYPFNAKARFTHLNMPGGQLMQEAKYTSEQLHNFHPVNNAVKVGVRTYNIDKTKTSLPSNDAEHNVLSHLPKRLFSTEVKNSEEKAVGSDSSVEDNKLTKKQRLKAAFKEYGATIVVLHITVSLASLGICYALISRGIDLEAILKDWGWSEGGTTAGAVGPFVVAYAVHKVLAPMRISLSLFITPFLVKYLRKKGFTLQRK